MRAILIAIAMLTAPALAAQSVPGLENFTLTQPSPTPTPTPAPSQDPAPTSTPEPTATPSATPTSSPSPDVTRPAAVASPTPPVATRRTPAATASPSPAPVVGAPLPTSVARSPDAGPTPTATPAAPATTGTTTGDARPAWWLYALAAGAIAVALATFVRRRQGVRAAPVEDEVSVPPPTQPAPPPAVPPKMTGGLITSSSRPVLAVTLAPIRISLDTLRVSLDYVVQLSNSGRGPAYDVAVEAWLISASREQDAELAQVFASAPGAPLLEPFTLIASAQAELSGEVIASRDHIAVITAGERRSFVPVLAVRASYRHGRDGAGVVTAAFMVGIPREGQALLAPIPLDRGTRRYDRLEARHYAPS